MALLAAARRASVLPVRRATALLWRRQTFSSARAMSFWSSSSSSSSSEDNEDPMATAFRTWTSIREKIDTAGAQMQELRLRHALVSAVQSRVTPVADLPGLLAQIEATTDYFPFKISENKRADAITLTRALKGEQIKVVVSMPSLDDDDDDDDDDNNEEKNRKLSLSSSSEEAKENKEVEKDTSQSTMHLEVTVSKGDRSNITFSCLADPDKIHPYLDKPKSSNLERREYMAKPTTKEDGHVDHDMATYDGFDGLNENLKTSFHEYLELRGITPKMMNLLRGYLRGKLRRKHTLWLNNLQDFVKKNDLTP